MHTSYKILRAIEGMPERQIFTSRDMRELGPRTVVDSTLSKLARTGVVERIAQGVYARGQNVADTISVEEIVQAKARSSGRVIFEIGDGRPIRASDGQLERIFGTDGKSTTFYVKGMRMRLVQMCAREIMEATGKHPLCHLNEMYFGFDCCAPPGGASTHTKSAPEGTVWELVDEDENRYDFEPLPEPEAEPEPKPETACGSGPAISAKEPASRHGRASRFLARMGPSG